MQKTVFFLVVFLFSLSMNAQQSKGKNLSKKQFFYFDPGTKTKVESTGYYYVDELGETTERHGQWTYFNLNGDKVEERQFNRNKLHGAVTTYYSGNRVKNMGFFKNNVQDSIYVSFSTLGDTLESGTYKLGEPIGFWRYFYSDGALKSIEEIKDGVSYIWEFYAADSLHSHIVKNGNGEMVDYYGNGLLKSWYNYKDGLKHGDFEEASVYGYYTLKGAFKNNKPEGKWEYYFISGDLEKVAHYKEGLLDGSYINYYDNEQIRVQGEYQAGMKVGKWTWFTNTGVVDMEGNFKNGLQHGSWIYNYPDGKVSYRAKFKDGKKDGKWSYYYSMGKKFKEGNFKDDKKDGPWKTWYESGTLLMEGDYKDDKEEGEWKNYWENGRLKNHSTFKDGQLDGEWTSFYDNGTPLLKGKYSAGYKTGEWMAFFANGQVSDIDTYKVMIKKNKVDKGSLKGRSSKVSALHGKSVTYSQKDFKKIEEGKYKNDKKTGKWITYHPGGLLPAVIANYKDGKLNGKMETYEFLGNKMITSAEYKDGVKHGKTLIYDKNGKVKREMKFENGEQVIEGTKGDTKFSPKR